MQWKQATDQSEEKVVAAMKSSFDGLTSEEAASRHATYGANRLEEYSIAWWHILLKQFQSSFIYFLLAAAALSFLLGEHTEAEMMLLFLCINATLGFFQEYRSTRAVTFLKKYLTSHSRVRRNALEMIVASEEIVPGDIVTVSAGDKIAADMYFIQTKDLSVDESILTGESMAVKKMHGALMEATDQMYKASNIGFAGTTVMHGSGVGVVVATGIHTVMGEVSHLVESTHRESTFEKGIRRFSRFIMRLVTVTIALIFIVNLLIKGQGANPIDLLIFSLVLAISVIPEALPFVVTVALSRGSLHLLKKNVIVKRLSAVEDLGSIEVLCSDKTGTLTENQLTVERVYASDKRRCAYAMALASDFAALERKENVDPFDRAIWKHLAEHAHGRVLASEKSIEIPFDPERRCNSVVISGSDGCELIVRGAPEVILTLDSTLSESDRARYERFVASQGEAGRRILAVASRILPRAWTPEDEIEELGVEVLGLVSFVDPIKSTAKDAIDAARRLGVSVKILTGDSREVSASVALRIGLINASSEVLTGEELDMLSHERKLEAVHRYHVFARVSPRQKYEIIELLQESKEVGFLGEGINDAPALKLANVALVVQGASDIARGAADVVLLDSSLSVIIDGIREGRGIFANMIKYIKTTLTSNFGNFYSVAITSLLIPFVPMLPLQILLLDILSDFPMIALATDAVDDEELQKPKEYNVKDIILAATLFGVISSVFDFILFATFFRNGESVLQTNWFVLSIFTELILIYSLRSKRSFFRAKRPAKALMLFSLLMCVAAIWLPMSSFGQRVFHFVGLDVRSAIWIGSLVLGYFVMTEGVKLLYYRIKNA